MQQKHFIDMSKVNGCIVSWRARIFTCGVSGGSGRILLFLRSGDSIFEEQYTRETACLRNGRIVRPKECSCRPRARAKAFIHKQSMTGGFVECRPPSLPRLSPSPRLRRTSRQASRRSGYGSVDNANVVIYRLGIGYCQCSHNCKISQFPAIQLLNFSTGGMVPRIENPFSEITSQFSLRSGNTVRRLRPLGIRSLCEPPHISTYIQ